MRKIISKIAGTLLVLSLAFGIGVGVAEAKQTGEVHAGPITVEKTAAEVATLNEWVASAGNDAHKYSSANLDDVVSMSFSGIGNTASYWSNGSTIKLYVTKGASDASITFSVASGYVLKTVTLTYTLSNAPSFPLSSGVASSEINESSVTYTLTGGSKNGQLIISNFSVTYDSNSGGGSEVTQYDVTFDYQGHGTNTTVKIDENSVVTKPADPSATGFVFGGWFKESDCTTPWDFTDDKITKDTTIYALWTEGTNNTVTFTAGTDVGSSSTNGSGDEIAKGGVTISSDDAAFATSEYRFYKGSTTTFTSSANILSITFTCTANGTAKYGPGSFGELEGYSYETSGPTGTWIGSATSVSFTASENQVRATKIEVLTEEITDVPLTNIGLKSTEEVIVGSTVTLVPELTPSNANTNNALSWESLNTAVATVSDKGVVTGVSVGTAEIKVHATDIGKTASCMVTVNPVPPVVVTHTIADCYTVESGTSVKFNGVYMGTYGTNAYQGIFFADGEYGIVVYGSSVDSSWEVGKTVLAITATTDCYNGLVQVKSASYEATSASVAAPVVYTLTGSETTPVALSRKTGLSGTVTAVNGTFASSSDTTVTIDLGNDKSANIFIKKNSYSSTQLSEYSEKLTVGSYVVATGFLTYYLKDQVVSEPYTSANFQIVSPTILSTEAYTAEKFAAYFISKTDPVCSKEEDQRLSGLQAIWTDLGASYSLLDEAGRSDFVDSSASDTIKNALARYSHICGKYNTDTIKVLDEFVEGATITYRSSNSFVTSANVNNNASTIIIVVVALTSITSIGVLLVIKRKRSLVK